MINVVRTALQALSAVLGGAQSLHTNGLDEAYAIPTEEAMKLALRTQQIIAEETGVPDVIDPLGGSYYVESLTNRDRGRGLRDPRARSTPWAGRSSAIEEGWFQREIADYAYETARRKASGEQPVIGVNTYVGAARAGADAHPPGGRRRGGAPGRGGPGRARAPRRARVAALLDRLAAEARDPAVNLMPDTIELVKARATLGEIVARLREVFGRYVEPPVF